jgi:D-tagatose-1,6-bisphosphate aldolase subunit GatZ/KbaZ
MYLDEIVAAQKRGEARGIASICSAHPFVLKQTLQTFERPLIEATCNQVNQYGGYTGMRPADFVRYLRGITRQNDFPFEQILLGGDHLGPSVWQAEPAQAAMTKAEALVRGYVEAGFVKIHLDCSMRLGDDPAGALDVEIAAERTARLARVAEDSYTLLPRGEGLRYVIGSEVPVPGGAMEHEASLSLTNVEDARQTIEVTRAAFRRAGLQSAWERVIALVVQPGVEFGDEFVFPYQAGAARELSDFIEGQPMVYEAHSTDYQTHQALTNLVRDHFAILKVGPALTFAFREAVFALAKIEEELIALRERSRIVSVLEQAMLAKREHWIRYYHGSQAEQAFKRKYSLSDRIRYYWTEPQVQQAFEKLMGNLNTNSLPATLLSQFVPDVYSQIGELDPATPERILLAKIRRVLAGYAEACSLTKGRGN